MKFVQLHQWFVKTETADCLIKAAMSPMLVAQEFCDNHMKEFVITGIYRLRSSNSEPMYSHMEDGDVNTPDILAVQCNFCATAVIADLGGRTLPMLLVMDDKEPVFTEIYRTFPWVDKLPDQMLITLVNNIDAKVNADDMISVYAKGADEWYHFLLPEERGKIFSKIPSEADKWWNVLTSVFKIRWFQRIQRSNGKPVTAL